MEKVNPQRNEDEFSWPDSAKRYVELYDKVVRMKRQ